MKKLIASAIFFGALIAGAGGAQAEGGDCVPIGGTALGQFYNDSKDVMAAMMGTWSGARGAVLNQRETETGLVLEMEHVFTTSEGGLVRTRDEVVLTAVPGKKDTYAMELAYSVVESFGHLEGYAGTFNSYGLVKMGSKNRAVVRYSGQICK